MQPQIRVLSGLRRAGLLVALVSLGALAAGCSSGDKAAAPGRARPSERVASERQALAGIDGSVTLTAANQVVNQYTTLDANAALNATSIQVTSLSALSNGADAIAAGDLVLIMQMQGATIDTAATDASWGAVVSLGNAGRYEFAEVVAVDASNRILTLSCALHSAYTTAGQTQVVRVPQYDTLTIAAGASLTAPAWNGATGGVVAVHAKTSIDLNGDVVASALGFRGGAVDALSSAIATDTPGYNSSSNVDGARKGEGIAGLLLTQYGRAPAANGGGGGNAHNAAGGGGANARSGGAWTGQGVFDPTVQGGAAAWLLDPGYTPGGSEGGGRGGYTYSGANLDATLVGPNDATWGGNQRRERGGLGGHPLDNDPATRIFLGGGGGAGDGNDGHAGAGGQGGGIVILLAPSVTGTGRILANGQDGGSADSTASGSPNGDAPGGAGAGGTVIVRGATISGFSVQANGGVGGRQIVANGLEAEGPGGGGGGGFVSVSGTVSTSVAGGLGGTTTAAPFSEFPSNGATRGAAGQALTGAAAVGVVPYCADTTAPDTTIESSPRNPTSDTTGDFTFTSDDAAATFECRVDGAAFAACAARFTTLALGEGSHSLEVRAKDAVGNVDAAPATFTWIVDTTPPDTSISTKPPASTTDPTGDFTFASEAGASFECRVDAAAYAACTANFTTGELAPGEHSLEVRATDLAGNVDPSPATYAWTVAVDSDADGVSDVDEAAIGSNPSDADSDDDGVTDGAEARPGEDGDADGLVNALDPDSDNDGIFDGTESSLTTPPAGTDLTRGHFVPDADPSTKTNPLDPDTDHGGVPDGSEDINHDGKVDAGERDPNAATDDVTAPLDSDGDGLGDEEERQLGSDPDDADSDDDGLLDGAEPDPSVDTDHDGLVNALDPDSDADGLLDGTEDGRDCSNAATDVSKNQCIADADLGKTTTSVLDPDTDHGGVLDGSEDVNRDGARQAGERDPLDASDDALSPSDGGAGGVGGVGGETSTGGMAGASGATALGGSAGSAGSGDTGGSAGAGGTAGSIASGGSDNSSGGSDNSSGGSGNSSGGTAGSANNAGVSGYEPDVVVLGGARCSYLPARAPSSGAWLLAALLAVSGRGRRKRAR